MMKKLLIITFISFGLLSCNDKLEIKKDFDFEVTYLPYRSSGVELGEQVEIRFQIRSIGGQYEGTTYYFRHFPFAGRGFLRDDNGRLLFPNDLYELENKIFRLYYQPDSRGQHTLGLWFFDSHGHQREITLSFSTTEEQE